MRRGIMTTTGRVLPSHDKIGEEGEAKKKKLGNEDPIDPTDPLSHEFHWEKARLDMGLA